MALGGVPFGAIDNLDSCPSRVRGWGESLRGVCQAHSPRWTLVGIWVLYFSLLGMSVLCLVIPSNCVYSSWHSFFIGTSCAFFQAFFFIWKQDDVPERKSTALFI
ncbi:MAG: hypothetical protein II415_09580 [Bacteroidaceae bacterium]|nr:hypothetical protein [Bacteroidaceae bacterium]